jgi:hypothetical protein
MANIVVYRKYPMRRDDHDPVTEDIRDVAAKRDLAKKVSVLHKLCGGLARGTISKLLDGTTRHPRYATVMALFGAMGVNVSHNAGKFDLDSELADAKRWNQRLETSKLAKGTKSKRKNGKTENRAAL